MTELDNAGIRGKVDGSLYADGKEGVRGVARLEVSALSLQGKAIPGASASLMLANSRLAGLVNMGDQERYLRTELAARLAAGKVKNFRGADRAAGSGRRRPHLPDRGPLAWRRIRADRGPRRARRQGASGARPRGDQNRLSGSATLLAWSGLDPQPGSCAPGRAPADVRLSPEGRIELSKFLGARRARPHSRLGAPGDEGARVRVGSIDAASDQGRRVRGLGARLAAGQRSADKSPWSRSAYRAASSACATTCQTSCSSCPRHERCESPLVRTRRSRSAWSPLPGEG